MSSLIYPNKIYLPPASSLETRCLVLNLAAKESKTTMMAEYLQIKLMAVAKKGYLQSR